ncbi:hypothetical protein [Altererythrobacter sp. Z27]|uniref:hypothetical protein n=1 Tax=Altererythrobacter sp. Z27 TaxID=3461147 RepID=UPI0040450A4B
MTSLPATTVNPTTFTREAQAAFCEHLSTHGNVRLAARAAGVHRATAYRMRRACGRFEELWKGALLLARSHAEELLADRALNGVEEKVFYHGEEVATRIRYDSRLLLAHLARLDRLTQDHNVREAAMFFDYKLEELCDAEEIGE